MSVNSRARGKKDRERERKWKALLHSITLLTSEQAGMTAHDSGMNLRTLFLAATTEKISPSPSY